MSFNCVDPETLLTRPQFKLLENTLMLLIVDSFCSSV